MTPSASARTSSLPIAAFTLVELLIVVIILAILAAIVIPGLNTPTRDAAQARFASNVHILAASAELYFSKEGSWPADGSSGLVPAGFEDYVETWSFERPTPIAGVWDTELNDSGVTSAIGVHFLDASETKDDGYMTEIDELMDDGDLATGTFRKLGEGRFYFVMAE